jgi:hypothetical protein
LSRREASLNEHLIDPANGRASVLILQPRDSFLEVIDSLLPRGESLSDVYFPEEDGVWMVPPVGSFGGADVFKDYLEGIKPKLLKVEVGRFLDDLTSFPYPWSSTTFDKFFEVIIRDVLGDVRNL